MRVDRILTHFACDNCHCFTLQQEQPVKFPYATGWLYLYNLDFKAFPKSNISLKDKHFCSVKCILEYLANLIEKEKNKVYGERGEQHD